MTVRSSAEEIDIVLIKRLKQSGLPIGVAGCIELSHAGTCSGNRLTYLCDMEIVRAAIYHYDHDDNYFDF